MSSKGHKPNWTEEMFLIKKVKITIPGTYVTEKING